MIASCAIFLLTYGLIFSERVHRTIAAMAGAVAMISAGIGLGFYDWETAVSAIDFNTIGLLLGMMIIVGILQKTGFFQYAAIVVAQWTRGNPWWLLLSLAGFTAVVSTILDNVTTIPPRAGCSPQARGRPDGHGGPPGLGRLRHHAAHAGGHRLHRGPVLGARHAAFAPGAGGAHRGFRGAAVGAAQGGGGARRHPLGRAAVFHGPFIVVGGLEAAGVLGWVSTHLGFLAKTGIILATLVILWVSALMSAVVDNIPFTIAMLPVIKGLSAQGVVTSPLWWALGVGFGGNATPIGATANVVAGLALAVGVNFGWL